MSNPPPNVFYGGLPYVQILRNGEPFKFFGRSIDLRGDGFTVTNDPESEGVAIEAAPTQVFSGAYFVRTFGDSRNFTNGAAFPFTSVIYDTDQYTSAPGAGNFFIRDPDITLVRINAQLNFGPITQVGNLLTVQTRVNTVAPFLQGPQFRFQALDTATEPKVNFSSGWFSAPQNTDIDLFVTITNQTALGIQPDSWFSIEGLRNVNP